MGESRENDRKARRFVGRITEMYKWNNWLTDSFAPLRLFFISGMGGIGKSSLMSEMMRSAKKRNAMGIWLDGRSCTPTPAGFLEYLSVTIGLEAWNLESVRPLDFLFHTTPSRRMVLCIDNYENLSVLEGWLMEVFMPKLSPYGITILFASRPALSLAWKTNSTWGKHVTELPLTYLSYDETAAYINSVGSFEKDTVGEMARASDGHPLALALAVDAAVKHNDPSKVDKMIVSQTISVHVLRELTSEKQQPLVDVLIVLQHASQEILSLILEKPVSVRQYQMLRQMSFVQSVPEGLALHDLARMHLLRDFRIREPKRLHALRVKAAAILYKQLQTADRGKRRMIAAQMLMLCKDMFPMHHEYVDVSVHSNIFPLEPIHKQDLPTLHNLLSEWCQYSTDPDQSEKIYHAFLDDLAFSFPESIVVLRGSDGEPIAMFISVLLYEDTSRLLLRYFSSELTECCEPNELNCEPDQADTYYAVLGAARNQIPGYTREELVGLLTLDRLSMLGEGLRAVLVATDSNLKVFLQKIGFHLRPTISRNCDTSYAKADVLEIDLRHNSFGKWVMSFLSEQSIQKQSVLSKDLTKREVRKLLSALHEPAQLQSFVPLFLGVESGIKLQKYMLSFLINEDIGLSEKDRNLLYITYYTHANNRIAAEKACNMSRATFYRHLQNAIANFAEMLNNRWM